MGEERKVPTSRLSRFARLAAIGARAGASAVLGGGGQSAAEQAADVLGTMRGLAAKMGQMASYVDGVIPEGQRDAYERAMTMLRAQAPRSSSAEVRALVESELGAPLESLFLEWDETPVASASIGQVHRATLKDGRVVAVKVQHAQIQKAVESDLKNASMLESLAGMMGGRRFDSKTLLEVIRRRFREELNYELEGQRLTAFRALHEGDPRIVIPELIADRSSKRVLTTMFLRGKSFEEACASDETDRLAWAETLWRFVFKGNLVMGKFNADPHPGNYFFLEDGAVAFIDYGCVQEIAASHQVGALMIHRAAIAKDEDAFKKGVSILIDAKTGRLEKLAQDYTRACFEPLFASPYRITRRYAASLVDGMKNMAKDATKIPADEFFTMPSHMLFMNRLQFGFYSVLARLDVECNYARVEEGFLPPAPSE
jgi:predicted unusual protein kinase regulating ubiquinone biosynthesis (AarF/ABC1/UbiB family)